MAQELQTAIHFRDSLRENGQEVEYKEQRNLVTAMESNKMKIYLCKLIECKRNAKNIWKANKKRLVPWSQFFPMHLTLTSHPFQRTNPKKTRKLGKSTKAFATLKYYHHSQLSPNKWTVCIKTLLQLKKTKPKGLTTLTTKYKNSGHQSLQKC